MATTLIPPDDLKRDVTLARPGEDQSLTHIGLVGDTYTILLSGKDTAGRYCLIDMHVPPGGGPPAHRHDFEESFTIMEGTIEGDLSRCQIDGASGRDNQYSFERAPSVSEH